MEAQTPEGLDITATTAKGNEYQVVSYVDPFPGKVGTDRVRETCAKCSGTGTVDYGHVTLLRKGIEDRWCFDCNGKGYRAILVSSLRATARRQAKAQTLRNAEAADWAAEAPAREAAEKAAEAAKEAREEALRAAKPKGFLGTEGERLRNLNAKVTMIRTYETQDYRTGAPTTATIIKFDVLGKTAIWFTSWTTLEEGDFVSLTGTVKSLGNRDGEDQTVLTRCITK
jgi:hypothetical protein